MKNNRATEFETKMLDTFVAHGINDTNGYLNAVKNAKEMHSRSLTEQEFKNLSIKFGLNERLFGTFSLLVAKLYTEYQESAIEAAYFINPNETRDEQASSKNAWLGLAAFVVVGFVAYHVVRNAPSDGTIGQIRDWVGGGFQQR